MRITMASGCRRDHRQFQTPARQHEITGVRSSLGNDRTPPVLHDLAARFPTRLPHLLQFILSVSRPAYPRKLSSIIARTMTSNSVSAPRRYCRTFTTATCPDPARLACGSQWAARLWCGNPPINGPSNVSNVVATESTCWPSAWKFRHAVRRSPLPRPAPRLTM
jgi:hypothetical protein